MRAATVLCLLKIKTVVVFLKLVLPFNIDAAPMNVSIVNVTSSCVKIAWAAVPPEQIGGAFQGYKVIYVMEGQTSSLPGEFVTNNLTHEAEICSLRSRSNFQFYVRRHLGLTKLGNPSAVQSFTTLEQGM